MTELETMQRAKMYLDKLAQGIDPITDREIPEDSALSNARLARCFFYVSGVLGQVIANGGTVGQRVRTLEFSLTPEQLRRVELSPYPVRITEFTEALYRVVDNPDMKKLSAGKVTEWLTAKGFMVKETGPDGKSHRIPTEMGRSLGLSTQLRQSRDGEYLAVYYSPEAQRFLLDNLGAIMQEK